MWSIFAGPVTYSVFNLALDLLCIIKFYHIAQNFDGGKFWRFWHFPARQSKFNPSIFQKQYSVYRCMVKDSNHPSKYFPSNIWRVTMCQNFPPSKFCAIRYVAIEEWLHQIGWLLDTNQMILNVVNNNIKKYPSYHVLKVSLQVINISNVCVIITLVFAK